MFTYLLSGALLGIVVGYILPPGCLFWFVVGAASGCLAQKYIYRRM